MYATQSSDDRLALKIKELRLFSQTLSFLYLSKDASRLHFNMEIYDFSENINNEVRDNCLSFEAGIYKIQREIDELKKQDSLLRFDKIEQYAAVRLEKRRGVYNVLLAQVGFVGGGTQIYTGGVTCLASFGLRCQAWGIPLISHGLNNMWEGGYYLLYRKNSPGWVRNGYRKIATTLGVKEDVGDYAYTLVDLSLSAYGVGQKVFKQRENSWKLYREMNNDYIYGWRDMGAIPLATEAVVDVTTGYSGYSEFEDIRIGK